MAEPFLYPQITWTPGADIGTTVIEPVQQFYMHSTAPDGKSWARPMLFLPFLQYINTIVDDAEQYVNTMPFSTAKTMLQNDISKWRKRYETYVTETKKYLDSDEPKPIIDLVLDPVIVGWFPGETNRKPPDVGTPFSIANQTKAGVDHFKDRRELFKSDLANAYEKLVTNPGEAIGDGIRDIWDGAKSKLSIGGDWVLGASILGGITIAAIIGGVAITRSRQNERRYYSGY